MKCDKQTEGVGTYLKYQNVGKALHVIKNRLYQEGPVLMKFDIKKYWHRWDGETVVVMASGPSMTVEDANYCSGKVRVITVNSTYKLAPWADVHYSSDHDWWEMNLPEINTTCTGELWTGHHFYIADGINHCPYDKKIAGISNKPGTISWGGNSGFCAVGLAVQFGASRIILLGFDMSVSGRLEHWHGSHDEQVKKEFNFPKWLHHFDCAYNDFLKLGIEVVNCSKETMLPKYKRAQITDVL